MRLPDRGLFRKYSKSPFVIGGECPDRRAEDQADVSVDFRLRANRRNPCLECDRSSLTQTKLPNV